MLFDAGGLRKAVWFRKLDNEITEVDKAILSLKTQRRKLNSERKRVKKEMVVTCVMGGCLVGTSARKECCCHQGISLEETERQGVARIKEEEDARRPAKES